MGAFLPCLAEFCFVLFDCSPLEANSFLKRKWRKGGSREGGVGRELGGVEGSETVARIHCMRKECIFNKKERKTALRFLLEKNLVKYFYKNMLLANMNVFAVHNKSSLFLLLEFFQFTHLIITILPCTSNTQI